MLSTKQFFMRDQAQYPVAAFMSESPRRVTPQFQGSGAGLALFVAALTILNILAVAPGG